MVAESGDRVGRNSMEMNTARGTIPTVLWGQAPPSRALLAVLQVWAKILGHR